MYKNTWFWIEVVKSQKEKKKKKGRYLKCPIIALKSYFLWPEGSYFVPTVLIPKCDL